MEGNTLTNQDVYRLHNDSSPLLEFAAINDLPNFKHAVEEEGHDLNQSSVWYGRRLGSNKMSLEERTPLMIASMFGSLEVLNFIIQTGLVDVNRACGSDGATSLHCAVAGGSRRSIEVVRLLVNSSADINCVDASGNRPCDVIARSCDWDSSSKCRNRVLKFILSRQFSDDTEVVDLEEMSKNLGTEALSFQPSNDGREIDQKKEYPIDPSLPDIKNGFYITDEFRMYMFKVKPCSRAYSHDWTECPFVHPGENARRRDPRRYNYTCVPCPEFRKGTCNKGDACEYAHGIFESWLHPAQYRTRLCKDETTCCRRVCFFAHKPEELRPLYASTGSGVPSSPRAMTSVTAPFDMVSSISPLALGSPSIPMMPASSTPPMTPPSSSSSPMGVNLWLNQVNTITPPTLQLAGSRLRTSLNARDVGLQADLQGLEHQMRRQQLLEELAGVSSPSRRVESGRFGGVKPSKLDEIYGSSLDPNMLPQYPSGMMLVEQNMSQQPVHSSFSSTLCSSPRGSVPSFRMDHSGASNPRLTAFARSQSFVERGGAVNQHSGLSTPASSKEMGSPRFLPDWGSSEGKSVWGVQGDELNKLRKSASFGHRSGGNNSNFMRSSLQNDPRVQSYVKDPPKGKSAELGLDNELKLRQYYLKNGGSEVIPSWLEQMYMEQEQIVA